MGNVKKRYVLWNNKGGVGKSTLTFHVGSEYALKHPQENILILDLCPQANATMTYFGGGIQGESTLLNIQTQNRPKTIVGFFSEQLSNLGATRYSGAVNASQFVHKVSTINPKIPDNVFIIPGDGNLEILLSALSYYANPQGTLTNTWKNVILWARDLCDLVAQELDRDVTIFIDTNPSFALYTQQAIVAADRIIVPFNADDSSRTGVGALFGLIYGVNIPHPVYQNYTFSALARQAGLQLPRVHLFVGNRFTQFQGTAKAFAGLSSVIQENAWNQFQTYPDRFTPRSSSIATFDDFVGTYHVDLRDFNSAGVVAANQGIPLTVLLPGRYNLYGETAQVNPDQIEKCRAAIEEVVDRL
ncbi:MAG: ParA family protein [Alicyclobacillus macrosporangiidus]|uniref:ParA family protein n=1 Tax=Alicyclobacillus macrosporangiidus TaxID=392015 RepID=UPI0026F21620|nr:ParA family protein [Alicyclobacillus macrosporangiidus]MCL6600344.1 ParA family protein [Alicyclobacillus macrosporangiidus]